MKELFELTIEESDKSFRRLDLLLTEKIEQLSRNSLQKLFEMGLVTDAFGQELSKNKIPPTGTRVQVLIPPPEDVQLAAANIPLDILWEDEHLIVLNKPQGLVVHPAPGHWQDTLVNALLFHCPNLPGIGHEKRPGIVHRLDRGTSGVMVVAKSARCLESLVNLFKSHDLTRRYEALAMGTLPQGSKRSIETLIGRSKHDRKKNEHPHF